MTAIELLVVIVFAAAAIVCIAAPWVKDDEACRPRRKPPCQ